MNENAAMETNDSPGEDMSLDRQSSEDVNESPTTGDGALDDPLFTNINSESKLRRRKGKIISCAKETIQSASRQLRRRVPYAGHLMTPRRLWLTKIPTQCDVVIEFPENAPDEALRWLLGRIRSPPPSGLELVVQVKSHESTKSNAFYISAPMNILFKAAEEARLPKRLRPELGGALREFTTRESHCFQQIQQDDGSLTLFTSQERQWLVLQVLQGLRAGQHDLEALQGRATVAEGQSIVAAWLETGLIAQIFPLHEISALNKLQANWVKKVFSAQPLDDIAEYFGVKVALYFAWLGHYTCALTVPAIFGTIIYVLLLGKGQTAQDIGHVLFSLFNVAWASLYLEAWKRYSIELAFRWGTLSTPPELLEPPRALYKGTLVENNVTGRLEPKEAPAWKRRAFRYLVSFPIIGFCLFLVFVVMFAMLRFQDWLDERNIPERGVAQCIYNLHKDWWDSRLPEDSIVSCFSVIPKVLLAGAITLMDEAYYKLAVWLNDQENYRLQSKYENHLIAKVALFQFVNSFLSLFYIAFYLRDEDKLKEQLAGLLISRQIIGNLRESAVPYVIEQWKLAKLSFKMWGALSPSQNANRTMTDTLATSNAEAKPNESTESAESTKNGAAAASTSSNRTDFKRNIGQAEIESAFYKYDGTFSDHLEMLVQIGYVVLFSAAFPLAGICALLNNMMEIRSDAFKLAHVHQRPFGTRVANIGTWQNALTLLSLAAVIVNCALIGLSGQVSRLWPGLTTTQTIVLIVTLEHIMLGLRSALTWILPELPSWLAAEIARAEHCRREMQCKGTSPRPTPPSSSEMNADSLPADLNTAGITKSFITRSQYNIEDRGVKDLENMPLHDKYMHFEDTGGEADVNADSSSPDSPPSQTSSILIRPLHEADLAKTIFNRELSNTSSSALQQLHIQEIPPFRKRSTDSADHTGSSASTSPQHARLAKSSGPPQSQTSMIPEIPPFRMRKISDDFPAPLSSSDKLSLKPHVPEWMARLKVNDNVNLRRSIDCIAKELTSNIESGDILKPAPSWSNIATKTSAPTPQMPSTSAGSSTNITKTPARKQSDGFKASSSKTHSTNTLAGSTLTLNQQPQMETEQTANTKTNVPAILATQPENVDEETKAAELAAKKSRLKQKLVKSARSVGIFSLKLKERRQREAEKAAAIAIEHAKALARMPPMPQPGGELSLIPIEQLIQIDDIRPIQKSSIGTASSSANQAPSSTSSQSTANQQL